MRSADQPAACWQSAIHAIGDGMAVVDVCGCIMAANAALARMVGCAPADLTGRWCCDLWPRLKDIQLAMLLLAMEHGRREERELDDGDGLFRVVFDPLPGGQSGVSGAVYTICDVTRHRRRAERSWQRSQAGATATLAAGVAHVFNNLLTAIMGNASLAQLDLDAGTPAHGRLQEILNGSRHAAELTGQLLAYAGKGRYCWRSAELPAVLRAMENQLHEAAPLHVKLTLECEDGAPPLVADAEQLRNLVLCLVNNAIDAIGGSPGEVRVSCRQCTLAAGEIDGLAAGVYHCLEVADTGCGMDAEIRARIFDPFFTTRFMGRGLGLSAAQGIAAAHGGVIQVFSEPGVGTTMRVLLPAAAGAV